MGIFKHFKIQKSGRKSILLFFIVLVLTACGGSMNSVDNDNFKELQELVSSGQFEIENNWVYPNNGGNINLIGNPNHIKFKKDSVDVYLPYFGVRHSGGSYGSDQGGIKYVGLAQNFQTKENPAKGNIEITFEAIENGESLDFRLTLYPNNNARTYVRSSQRTTISYEGKLSELEKD